MAQWHCVRANIEASEALRLSVDPKYILKPARVARYGGLDVRLGKGCTLLGVVVKGLGTRRIITQSLRACPYHGYIPLHGYRMHWPIHRRASEASEPERDCMDKQY